MCCGTGLLKLLKVFYSVYYVYYTTCHEKTERIASDNVVQPVYIVYEVHGQHPFNTSACWRHYVSPQKHGTSHGIKICVHSAGTVDGRNPAPAGMHKTLFDNNGINYKSIGAGFPELENGFVVDNPR